MQMHAPEAGLASLLASRGRNGDSMLVHMAPEELKGLQALAMAHGGELTINPETGLYEASFLKQFLPMIAGAVLNTFAPGIGSAIGRAVGFGEAAAGAAGTALLVGGISGLVEGDLKKGLMAGLGAYSGANIAQSLQAAAAPAPLKVSPAEAAKNVEDIKAAKALVGANPVEGLPAGLQQVPTLPATVTQAPDLSALQPVEVTGRVMGTPTAQDLLQGRVGNLANQGISPGQSLMTGASNLFTSPQSRSAFGQALGGGFESPFAQNVAKYATFAGAANAFTPEPQAIPTSGGGDDYMYIPGAMNPKYGTGANEPYYLPGRYYKKTAQGLVPYNPFQMAPGARGFAYGGMVSPSDQNMNQPRRMPDQGPVMPYPNQNYPLSTIAQSSYSSQPINRPQAQEVVSGYEPKINPFTGEEKFADGGDVNANTMSRRPTDPGRADPTAPTSLKDYYQGLLTPPTQQPRDLSAMNTYLADLQNRAKNPVYNPYGMVATQGAGALSPLPYTKGPATYDDGTGSGAAGGVDPITGALASYGLYKGLPVALNAAKNAFGIGSKPVTPTDDIWQSGAEPTPTTGTQQPTGTQPTGAENPPVLDPVRGVVIAGGTTAAALAAAKALAASKGVMTIEALDGTVLMGGGAGAAAAGAGAAGAGSAAGAGGVEAAGAGVEGGAAAGSNTLGSKIIPGAQTALGAYLMYKGIEQGKAGQAALGGYGAGAGIGALSGLTGAGGSLAPILGMNPVGLGLAALAAIGSTLVQNKEMGDVALRNYWKSVDSGRQIGETPSNELALGFINFYRTNKNEFPGQAKYGRTGNSDFMYDMTQVINKAVEKGEVPKDATPDVILKQVVQPWLDTMGRGPQHPDARRIQDFMMTDLIHHFMQGKDIDWAQVKGDKGYKMVTDRPIYAGTLPKSMQPPAPAAPADTTGAGIPEARNPFGYGDMQFANGGEIGTNEVNFGFAGGGDTEYLAGGKLLDGPGDGMSDDIPAVIRGKRVQRAALADGEFVVPADVVSHLGNGSTKAGAKKLYAMMDRLRKARTGRTRQSPAVDADRMLPA